MIWQALASPTSLEGLVDLIEGEYQGSRDQMLQDVVLFLSDMRSAGLIAIANALEGPSWAGSAPIEPRMIQQVDG
jgi:hypothetical protein